MTYQYPPELRDKAKRDRFTAWLVALVDAGIQERESLKARWDQVESFYRGDPVPWSCRYWKGAVLRHFPLITPKLDQLSANVIGTITSQKPYVLGSLRGSSRRLESLENQLQFFGNVGGLDEVLQEISPITGCTNHGIIRVSFEASARGFMALKPQRGALSSGPVQFAGLEFDPLHPNDFVYLGSSNYGLTRATGAAHRFWRFKKEIEQFQAIGRYIRDEEVRASGSPAEHESGRDFTRSRLDMEAHASDQDAPVELWEVYVKADLGVEQERDQGGRFKPKARSGERYWRITLAKDQRLILRIEPYDGSRPPYAVFRYKPKEYGSAWSSGSVGYDLVGLQMQKIEIRNLLNYGSQYNLFKPVFTDAAIPEKHVDLNPGKLYGVPGTISSPSSGFDPGTLMQELEWIERDADAITRIPQNGTGQRATKDGSPITATESQQMGAAMQVGINQYIQTFGQGLIDLAEISMELLHQSYEIWSPVYGSNMAPEVQELLSQAGIKDPDSQVYVDNPSDFLLPVQWELQGKSQESTPGVQLSKLQMASQMAQAANTRAMQLGKPTVPFDLEEIDRGIFNQLGLLNTEKIMPEGGVQLAPTSRGLLSAQPGMGGDPQSLPGEEDAAFGGLPGAEPP